MQYRGQTATKKEADSTIFRVSQHLALLTSFLFITHTSIVAWQSPLLNVAPREGSREVSDRVENEEIDANVLNT